MEDNQALLKIAEELLALAARCDMHTNPEKVHTFGATCIDQVPLPEPHGYIDVQGLATEKNSTNFQLLLEAHRAGKPRWSDYVTLIYTADQLRTHREEYAETVAAPLRNTLEVSRRENYMLRREAAHWVNRAETAERERDEARAKITDIADHLRIIYAAVPSLPITQETMDAATDVLHAFCLMLGIQRIRLPDESPAIDSAMGDSKTTVAEDVAALRKIVDGIEGRGDG